MSDIFEANHIKTGRRVAIKVLPRNKLNHTEYLARLEREQNLLKLAAGTGSVELLDWGVCSTFGPYLVMEYLIGRPLDGILISDGRMPLEDALPILIELSNTLAKLHELGIVHRDIKPANVFITAPSEGVQRAVLLDFGVSAMHESPSELTEESEFDVLPPQVDRLTTRGELLGTIEYMSPEQLMAIHEEIDFESDIFSLGVLTFELLSGELPYGADWVHRLHNLHHNSVPRGIDQLVEGVPMELAQLISRMIANRRCDRPASMQVIHQALKRVAAELPLEQRLPALEGRSGIRSLPNRRHYRVSYASPIRVIADSKVFNGRSEDISEGGMLLISRFPLAPGEHLAVRFALPYDGKITQADAVVRWCRESRGRVAIGLMWADPPEEFTLAIRSYIDLMLDPDRTTTSNTLLDVQGSRR